MFYIEYKNNCYTSNIPGVTKSLINNTPIEKLQYYVDKMNKDSSFCDIVLSVIETKKFSNLLWIFQNADKFLLIPVYTPEELGDFIYTVHFYDDLELLVCEHEEFFDFESFAIDFIEKNNIDKTDLEKYRDKNGNIDYRKYGKLKFHTIDIHNEDDKQFFNFKKFGEYQLKISDMIKTSNGYIEYIG